MSLLEIYWRALRYLTAERRKVGLICAANVSLAIIAIAEPVLFGRIIDAITEKSDVVQTMALWAGLGVFSIIAYVLVARGADRLAHLTRARVLSQSFEKVITMPLSWHHQRGTSNALHTLLRAVDALFSLWLEFMRLHLSTAVALLLLIPTALTLDLRMSMVLLVLGCFYVAIDQLVMRKTKVGQASVERHYHRVFAHVSDSVSNVSVLQSYNRITEETKALEQYTSDLLKAQFPVLDWWALASALHRLASTISMMVVLLIGAYLVTRGEMRIGDVVAFTGFATLMIGRLDQVTAFVNQVFEAGAKLEDFYRLEDAVADRKEPDGLREIERLTGHVRFEDVNFSFPNSTVGVRDISFDVPAGQTVAIVGPTGAGKTTLINLLQRVYDPNSGRILVDGMDTRTITRRSLRHSVATVFQDAGLFNRSIEENIRIGRTDASYDDVHAAARAAAAQDFILAKSEGYDTQVGERGGQLSGGERQRIAIARAILKDAPILVLDEATSALDVETEARVKEAIDRLRANRTTFIIAHRLSTVRDADLIIFMDNGHIVEKGGFAELSASNGRFAGLLRAGGLLTDDEVRRVAHIAIKEVA
ncbi:glucan ABC transporter ATP-binding protein/ permease [Mesorhizobium sp. L-8-3]|uniref:glucan ABC transporter ATP-binding protein/ permease n=1 Tax=Mesorhizobium sp. L-8-3 TaxID=2744522 RepID=UPI0019262EE1|nr:glucan ABC transporter ATP-binding protein/ permease [Mesorhizobium sp. L-8-3]BCH23975.1 beta-(1-->2)glucan export ATP-binding/permease protein NdvA [Mesorhizobium sp. L-8-3]